MLSIVFYLVLYKSDFEGCFDALPSTLKLSGKKYNFVFTPTAVMGIIKGTVS
jgi:hypothetical protein